MDFEFQKCPIFVGSLQNPAASNQKGFYTKITQNSSVYLGFDAEVPQKILQGLYCLRQGLLEPGHIPPLKNFKMPVFLEIFQIPSIE